MLSFYLKRYVTHFFVNTNCWQTIQRTFPRTENFFPAIEEFRFFFFFFFFFFKDSISNFELSKLEYRGEFQFFEWETGRLRSHARNPFLFGGGARDCVRLQRSGGSRVARAFRERKECENRRLERFRHGRAVNYTIFQIPGKLASSRHLSALRWNTEFNAQHTSIGTQSRSILIARTTKLFVKKSIFK